MNFPLPIEILSIPIVIKKEYSESTVKMEFDDYYPNSNSCGISSQKLSPSPNKTVYLEYGEGLIDHSAVIPDTQVENSELLSRLGHQFSDTTNQDCLNGVPYTCNSKAVWEVGTSIVKAELMSPADPVKNDSESQTPPTPSLIGNRKAIVLLERLLLHKNGKVILPTTAVRHHVSNYSMERRHRKIRKAQWSSNKTHGKATFGLSKKGKPQLHLDGSIYNRKAEGKSGIVYWKCVEQLCKTWVKQKGDKFVAPAMHKLPSCIPYQPRKPKVRERKVHRCSFCDKSFPKRSAWVVHERTHTGEKPFVCYACNRNFATSGALIAHTRCHAQEKRYKCFHFHCDYRGLTSSSLKAHVRKHHTAKGHVPKPYRCEYCGLTFAKNQPFVEHQHSTHDEMKPFTCSICSRTFRRSVGLSTHRRAHEIEELEQAEVHLDDQ